MTDRTDVPISADYFILSLMRLDRDHYQRIEAVRSVTGDSYPRPLLGVINFA